MIKRNYLLLLVLFSSLFFVSLVSAFDLGYFLDRSAYQIQPVAQFFLGGYDYTGYMLFEKFLFFFIIFAITFIALSKAPFFEGQRNSAIIISLAVPLIAIRYLHFEWLNTMILSYQVFGVALISFIPFVIYFFFLTGIAPESGTVRKIGWILFLCVYLGLYFTSDDNFYGEVYLWTALVAFIFFLADGTIRRAMLWTKIRQSGKESIAEAELSVRRRMVQLSEDYNRKIIDERYFNKEMLKLKKQQKNLLKYTVQ